MTGNYSRFLYTPGVPSALIYLASGLRKPPCGSSPAFGLSFEHSRGFATWTVPPGPGRAPAPRGQHGGTAAPRGEGPPGARPPSGPQDREAPGDCRAKGGCPGGALGQRVPGAGCRSVPPQPRGAGTHRLLDDAGDDGIGQVQVLRSLRHPGASCKANGASPGAGGHGDSRGGAARPVRTSPGAAAAERALTAAL